jgi:hypothetical protein
MKLVSGWESKWKTVVDWMELYRVGGWISGWMNEWMEGERVEG